MRTIYNLEQYGFKLIETYNNGHSLLYQRGILDVLVEELVDDQEIFYVFQPYSVEPYRLKGSDFPRDPDLIDYVYNSRIELKGTAAKPVLTEDLDAALKKMTKQADFLSKKYKRRIAKINKVLAKFRKAFIKVRDVSKQDYEYFISYIKEYEIEFPKELEEQLNYLKLTGETSDEQIDFVMKVYYINYRLSELKTRLSNFYHSNKFISKGHTCAYSFIKEKLKIK